MNLTTKPWWQSKTMMGAAAAVVAGLLGLLGVDVDASTQDMIIQNIASIASTLGGLLAAYGRVKAKHLLGG